MDLALCPVCHKGSWTEIPPQGVDFHLFQCPQCRCYQIRIDSDPSSSLELYRRYYSAGDARRFSGFSQLLWQLFRRQRARLILTHAPAGASICDIGCERGELLRVLKQRGCRVWGTQMSQPAADFSRERFGIDVHVGELSDARFSSGAFDAVLMFHVLEHLPHPESYLKEVWRILKPGGAFWVEVPNAGSLTAVWGRKKWLHHDPEHHFWSFNKEGLIRLLAQHGFSMEWASHYSWQYGPIGSVQTWLNFLPGPQNIFYGTLCRGFSRQGKRLALQLLHAALFGLLLPAGVVVSALEGFMGNGAVLLVRARKNGS